MKRFVINTAARSTLTLLGSVLLCAGIAALVAAQDREAEARIAAEKEAAAKAADEEAVREVLKKVEEAERRARDAAEFERRIRLKLGAEAAAKEAAAKAVEPAVKAEADTDEPKSTPADSRPLYERTLAELKIEITAEGLRDYLVSLHPTDETRRELGALIERLGHESYTEREAAMDQIRRRLATAMDILRGAIAHKDPEVRWRAKRLLDEAAQRGESTLYAVYQAIEKQKIHGLAEPILASVPLCTRDATRTAARRALVATARRDDVDIYRSHLAHKDAQVRVAAVEALGAIDKPLAVKGTLPLLEDENAHVRMAVARLLASASERRSLEALVSLLDTDEITVRAEAGRILKAITGKNFGYVAYDRDEARAEAITRWRQWIAGEGATADLLSLESVKTELGRILICSFGQQKIMEYDLTARPPAKPLWEIQTRGKQPWAVAGAPDGSRMIGIYTQRTVMLYGPGDEGSVLQWESEALPGGPMGLCRLDDGQALVACSDADLIVKLNAEGKIVRRWSVSGRPVDVQQLPSGNMLVTLQNAHKVVEIDPDGKVTWNTTVAMQNPFSAQRLENGNTLIAALSSSKVLEVNPEGNQEVWSLDGIVTPYQALRLENGNTLVADQTGVREYEVDPETKKKTVVWELPVQHISRVSRF